jgi:hypothetical protein
MQRKPSKAAREKTSSRAAPAVERANLSRAKFAEMTKVVDRIEGVRPASRLIREIEVVPTIFPAFDYHVDVGGLPTSTIVLVHGPSAEGKTPFVIGLGRSFLERNHFFNWIDVEYSTPAPWMRQQLGPYYEHPFFTAPVKIGTYENVRSLVRRWCDGIGEARNRGDVPEDTVGVCVIDSISQLIPETAWDEMRKAATTKAEAAKVAAMEAAAKGKKPRRGAKPKSHIDGLGGRLGQIQAGYNAVWVKELRPILYETRCTMVVIARETLVEGEGFFAQEEAHVGGGRHLKYGSDLWLRAVSDQVWQKRGEENLFVGHKHTIEIHRTKFAPKTEKIPEAYYHTSNGVACPEGFDRERDVLALASEMGGILDERGSNYYFAGEHLGNGVPATLEKMRTDHALAAAIELECRSKFGAKSSS